MVGLIWMLPLTLSADEIKVNGAKFTYSIVNDEVTIIQCSPITYTQPLDAVTVPQEICEKPVRRICSGTSLHVFSDVLSVVIPEGVRDIGDYAFAGCRRLNFVSLPDSVTNIGYCAFDNCTGLTSVTLPQTLGKIGDCAFEYCTGLSQLVFPSALETIGKSAFGYCENITNVVMNEGLKSIGGYAFQDCKGLTEIDIPISVTNATGAFPGCYNIQTVKMLSDLRVNLPHENVTNLIIKQGSKFVRESAFSSWGNISDVVIPDSVCDIQRYAFLSCSKLQHITLSRNLTNIDWHAFSSCVSLKSIEIPSKVKWLGPYTFGYCHNLEEVSLPYGMTNVWPTTFSNCENIRTATVPSIFTLKSLFPESYKSIEHVSVSEGEVYVSPNLFEGCYSIRSVSFPKSVVSLGEYTLGTYESVSFAGACPENYLYSGIFSPRTVKLPAEGSSEYDTYPKLCDVVKLKGLSGLMVRDEDGSVCLQVEGDLHIDWMDYISSTDLKSPFKMSVTRYFSDTTGNEICVTNDVLDSDWAFHWTQDEERHYRFTMRVPLDEIEPSDGRFLINATSDRFKGSALDGVTELPYCEYSHGDAKPLNEANLQRGDVVRIESEGSEVRVRCDEDEMTEGIGMPIDGRYYWQIPKLKCVPNREACQWLDGRLDERFWGDGEQFFKMPFTVIVNFTESNYSTDTPFPVATMMFDIGDHAVNRTEFLMRLPGVDDGDGLAQGQWPLHDDPWHGDWVEVHSKRWSAGACEWTSWANEEYLRTYPVEGNPPTHYEYHQSGWRVEAGWRFYGWKLEEGDCSWCDDLPTSAVRPTVSNCLAKTDCKFNAVYELITNDIEYVETKGVANSNPSHYTVLDEVVFDALDDVPGWEFAGWSPAMIHRGSTGDVIAVAKWMRVTNDVMFVVGEYGTVASGEFLQRIEYGQAASVPEVLAKKGWRFVGWDADVAAPIVRPTVFTACYEPIVYSIAYENVMDVENPNPTFYTITNEIVFAALKDVTGFSFVGWSPERVNRGSTGDLVVSAQWAVKQSIEELLAENGQVWSIGGDAKWTSVWDAEKGRCVARSGAIMRNQQTWIEMTVSNAVKIVFDWKTSCEPEEDGEMFDGVTFSIDGEVVQTLCGESEWINGCTYFTTGAGEHKVRWTYSKDSRINVGDDCAWVANVRVSPCVTISFDGHGADAGTPPASVSAVAGEAVILPGAGTLARTKHLFSGWDVDGEVFAGGSVVESPTTDAVYRAVWERKVLDRPQVFVEDAKPVGENEFYFTNETAEVEFVVTQDAIIRYAMDGNEPTADSPVYCGPIPISGSVTVKARAYAEDWFESDVLEVKLCRAPWTLSECVNAEGLSFVAGGDAIWCRDLTVSHDGRASLRSGMISHKQVCWLEAKVTGEGVASFWCKVSSEAEDDEAYDGLRFYVDGMERTTKLIGGNIDWMRLTFKVDGAGEHLLRWQYEKDRGDYAEIGSDCAWIDEFQWSTAGDPIPLLPDTATPDEVRDALAGSADVKLIENITEVSVYAKYREWALRIGADEVKSAGHAWVSFALDCAALLEKSPTDEDLTIEEFMPTAENGKFDFMVSVKDVEIGSEAQAKNLKKMFDISGADTLDMKAFDPSNVVTEFGKPHNGKVLFSVKPNKKADTFFMAVKMKN